MRDIFDEVAEEKSLVTPEYKQATSTGKDIFDEVAESLQPQGDIFDTVATESTMPHWKYSGIPEPFDEQGFQSWYQGVSNQYGLNPNPDDPQHYYDYRKAYEAGAMPDETGHWPSEFKTEGHPRMVVGGVNTKTGEIVKGQTMPFSPLETDDENASWLDTAKSIVKGMPGAGLTALGGLKRGYEEGDVPGMAEGLTKALPESMRIKPIQGEAGADMAKRGTEMMRKSLPDKPMTQAQQYAHGAGQSVLQNLTWLIPAIITKNPAVALGGMGLMSAGQAYQEQREGGMSPATSKWAAMGYGASEVATEFIPVGIYLKPGLPFVKRVLSATMAEVPTEIINELAQAAIDKVTVSRDMPLKDVARRVFDTAIVTLMSSPLLAGGTHSVSKLLKGDTKKMHDARKGQYQDQGMTEEEASAKAMADVADTQAGKIALNEVAGQAKEGMDQQQAQLDQYASYAEQYGATFNGMQETPSGSIPMFTDQDTGSSFVLKDVAELDKRLTEVREEFAKANQPIEEEAEAPRDIFDEVADEQVAEPIQESITQPMVAEEAPQLREQLPERQPVTEGAPEMQAVAPQEATENLVPIKGEEIDAVPKETEMIDMTTIPQNAIVEISAIRGKTGQVVRIKENAQTAVKDLNMRKSKFQALMECLKA